MKKCLLLYSNCTTLLFFLLPGFSFAFPAEWNQTFRRLLHDRKHCSSFQVKLIGSRWNHQTSAARSRCSRQVRRYQGNAVDQQCTVIISLSSFRTSGISSIFCRKNGNVFLYNRKRENGNSVGCRLVLRSLNTGSTGPFLTLRAVISGHC